jgi:hypothetical protein
MARGPLSSGFLLSQVPTFPLLKCSPLPQSFLILTPPPQLLLLIPSYQLLIQIPLTNLLHIGSLLPQPNLSKPPLLSGRLFPTLSLENPSLIVVPSLPLSSPHTQSQTLLQLPTHSPPAPTLSHERWQEWKERSEFMSFFYVRYLPN